MLDPPLLPLRRWRGSPAGRGGSKKVLISCLLFSVFCSAIGNAASFLWCGISSETKCSPRHSGDFCCYLLLLRPFPKVGNSGCSDFRWPNASDHHRRVLEHCQGGERLYNTSDTSTCTLRDAKSTCFAVLLRARGDCFAKKTRTDFVQRPAALKFENVFEISEVRVKGGKLKPWIPPKEKSG